MSDTSPPARFAHGVGRVRDAASRSAVPPNIALLELAQGAWRNVRTATADTGGRERTAGEYANLLSREGFQRIRMVPTAGPASLVEAVPA